MIDNIKIRATEMTKREKREIATRAARHRLRELGYSDGEMTLDCAVDVLDEMSITNPQTIASQWQKTASKNQYKLFRSEWNSWLKIVKKAHKITVIKIERELAALKTLRFCRKHKKDYREWGYPDKFVKLIDDLEITYPNSFPTGWILQRGKISQHKQIMRDVNLVNRVIESYQNG